MKAYRRLFCISIIVYITCALLLSVTFTMLQQEDDKFYRVEINQIMKELESGKDLTLLKSKEYQRIHEIEILLDEQQTQEKEKAFYEEDNAYATRVQPLYKNNRRIGYVKFTYQSITSQKTQIFYMTQGMLALLEGSILMLLFYMNKHIIKPFHTLRNLPYEISKGHMRGEVYIEKSKYFSDYLWGMSQLKDTLDSARIRQYEVMKEKKQLLLSLSHDIKTPLNLIKLYSKALQENLYEDEEKQKDVVKQIEIKSNEIEKYVESIISSTKEDIIDFNVENKEFYLAELMEKVLPIYREQCSIHNIQFLLGNYENRLLKGDVHRAQEVLENIFENAMKYGDGNIIEVSFQEEEYHQLIKIKNSGNTIPSTELLHIFESFYRGSNAQGCNGSGLGLYICRELMRKMDGAIYANILEDGMEFVLVFS